MSLDVDFRPWPPAREPITSPARTSLHCPICGAATRVVDSRLNKNNSIRRRRACFSGHRFTTTEIVGTPKITKSSSPKLAQLIKILDDFFSSPQES